MASTTTGTTIRAMTPKYSRSAPQPREADPVAAHTDRGMIITMTAMTASVFKKVITWQ